MAFDSINSISSVGARSTPTYERAPQSIEISDASVRVEDVALNAAAKENDVKNGDADAKDSQNERQKASSKSVEDAVKRANNKMTKTHCEFSYNDEVNRVSITVYDDNTGEVVREIPPEESLKMLEKLWELAGLMVDEKR